MDVRQIVIHPCQMGAACSAAIIHLQASKLPSHKHSLEYRI